MLATREINVYNNKKIGEKSDAMLQEAIITKIREDGLAEVVVERLGICGGDCNLRRG